MRLLFVEDDIKIVTFVVDGLKHAGVAPVQQDAHGKL